MKYPSWRWPRSYIVVSGVIGTLCVLACSGAVAQASAQAQKTGIISGHVYRADTGDPIARALVTLTAARDDSKVFQYTKTDSNGAYSFLRVAPGEYNVQAEHSGFRTSNYEDSRDLNGLGDIINLKSGEEPDKIDVRLDPVGSISGTVVDEDNEPVKGLYVTALRPFFLSGGLTPIFSFDGGPTTTDDVGHFRLSGLDAGSFYIRVGGFFQTVREGLVVRTAKYGITYYSHTFSLGDAQRIRVTPGTEVSDINIVVTTQYRAYTVSGTVVNPAGSADRRSSVIIHRAGVGPHNFIGRIATANVNAEGSFAIPGIPPGEYVVTAEQTQTVSRNPGQAASAIMAIGEAAVHVEDSDMKVNIVMERPSEVRGSVTWDAGAQVRQFKNLWVRLVTAMDLNQVMENLPDEPVGKVDESGGFDLQDVRPGHYMFSIGGENMTRNYLKRVQCSGADFALRPINVDAGMVVSNCTLALASDSGVISGQVLDGDTPVKGFQVVAIPESASLRHFEAYTKSAPSKTDSNGRFQIVGVIPGDYLLFAVPTDPLRAYYALEFADRNLTSGERVTVKASESKTVNLKPTATPQ